MSAANNVAKSAALDIEKFLYSFKETQKVVNVEDDDFYRKKDIDLLWYRNKNNGTFITSIEIKADRYHHTGNYFFETISNKTKNTEGCFLYTEADYVFYYFIEVKELHVLPMPITRDWFKKNIQEFTEKETSTPVGNEFYITVGRLVNRSYLKNYIKNVRIEKL